MKRILCAAAVATALLVSCGVMSVAATKKPAPKKPTVKKPASTTNHATLGTTQLKGEYADMGSTYTLGKTEPINITLKSAEYSIDPFVVGDTIHIPNADQKLLVMHFTYHNPNKDELFVRWDTLGFTVVDPRGENHDGLLELGSEKDRSAISMSLKPAQKIDVFGAMMVPAAGEMPKLIIKSGDDTVLRYDLRGKVKGLPAAYADPADKSGATPFVKIPSKMGTSCPIGEFSIKIDKAEYSTASKMGESELSEGQKFLILYLSAKNISPSQQFMRWDSLTAKLTDTDDVEVGQATDMFQASKDRSFQSNIQPGQEISLRWVLTVPSDTDLKKLEVSKDNGHVFEFDMTGVK